MDKTVLSLYQGEKEKQRSPITFHFPEPKPEGDIDIGKMGDSGKGWQTRSLNAAGIGRLFCYRQYRVTRPTTFVTEPSEPAVCLRIHVGNGSSLGYGGEETAIQLDFRDNRIFWQGDRVIENRLEEDEHTLVELYLRPECLSHLSGYREVMAIIDQCLSEPSGPIDQYEFSCSGELDAFIWKLLEEIDTQKTSVERFHYLCDCLLLICLGQQVDVQPPSGTTDTLPNKEKEDIQKRYEPSVPEKDILAKLMGKQRKELTEDLAALLTEIEELKQTIGQEQTLGRKVREAAEKIRRPVLEKLANIYLEAAYFLAGWIKKNKTRGKLRKLLKLAIVKACEDTFELRLPNLAEMEFYAEWTGKPYVSAKMETGKLTDLLSLLLPPGAPKLDAGVGTLRSNNLLIEQIRESFGFDKMSDFTGETTKDKPEEVVELYQRLMEHFCQTLDLGKDGGLQRSDIVRELDVAYERGDLLTLLQIEAENLAGDPGYIARQDDERLCWMIVALRFERDNYKALLEEMKEDHTYHDLHRFHRMGDDMKKFRSFIIENIKEVEEAIGEFAIIMDDITSHPSEGKAVILAECILLDDEDR